MELIALYIALWLLLMAATYWLFLPLLGMLVMGDGPAAVLWFVNRLYVRLLHNLKATGTEFIPNNLQPGPLVVVCNHQSPIDPLLVQSRCRFKIRWLMAREYMIPSIGFVWRLGKVIPISRDGTDSAGLRAALRHLRSGGVIGVFPEGGIKEPRGNVHPFLEGAGAMIAKTNAKVLLAVVDGTPTHDDMRKALFMRSSSTVQFVELISFPEKSTGDEITQELRHRISEIMDWPLVD